MSDYFIDLTAGSNGDGSSGSPWNQFTSSEHSSVVANDSLWFRRCATSTLITFVDLAVDYIGWPLIGDPLYNSRPAALQAAWDPDTEDYCVQTTSTTSVWTMLPFSDNTIHRFYGEYNYQSYNGTAGALKLDTKQDVTFNHCKFSTWNSSNSATGWNLYINNSTSIIFNDCVVHDQMLHTTVNYMYSSIFYFIDSYVTFNDSQLTFSNFGQVDSYSKYHQANVYTSNYVSKINNTTLLLNNTDFITYLLAEAHNYSSVGAYTVISIYGGSEVTISGGSTQLLNEAAPNDIDFLTSQGSSFYNCQDAELTMQDHTIIHKSNKFTLVSVMNGGVVIVNNIDLDFSCSNLGTCFYTKTASTELYLTNVSGTIQATDPSTKYNGSFLTLYDLNCFDSANSNLDNVDVSGNVVVLNGYHPVTDVTVHDLIVNSDSKLFTIPNVTLYTAVHNNISFMDVTLDSINIIQSPWATTSVLAGTSRNILHNVQFKDCTFTSAVQSVHLLYKGVAKDNSIVLDMIGCTGTSVLLNRDSSFVSSWVHVYSKYNNGFSGIINELPTNYELISLNDDFTSNSLRVETQKEVHENSTVSRTGGAGFSNYVVHKALGSIDNFTQFPRLGQDNLWVNLPSAGTYTITGYLLHIGATSLAVNDVALIVEKFEGIYAPASSTSLIIDTSAWDSVTNSTAYRLVTEVTVTYAQFIAVHFLFNNIGTGDSYYIDPKLEVA